MQIEEHSTGPVGQTIKIVGRSIRTINSVYNGTGLLNLLQCIAEAVRAAGIGVAPPRYCLARSSVYVTLTCLDTMRLIHTIPLLLTIASAFALVSATLSGTVTDPAGASVSAASATRCRNW